MVGMLMESGWVGMGPGNDDEYSRASPSSGEETAVSETPGTTRVGQAKA